jgi:hypothetical protein
MKDGNGGLPEECNEEDKEERMILLVSIIEVVKVVSREK